MILCLRRTSKKKKGNKLDKYMFLLRFYLYEVMYDIALRNTIGTEVKEGFMCYRKGRRKETQRKANRYKGRPKLTQGAARDLNCTQANICTRGKTNSPFRRNQTARCVSGANSVFNGAGKHSQIDLKSHNFHFPPPPPPSPLRSLLPRQPWGGKLR